MKWITREKIKVDRVACPWLIKHFVDPEAEFVFLPHATDWSKIDPDDKLALRIATAISFVVFMFIFLAVAELLFDRCA